MLFLVIGITLAVLKYMEIGPVAGLPWWAVLIPFALAVIWWKWADSSGYTKRKQMERENRKNQERLERRREAITNINSAGKKKRR
jgi:small Trp-rich protein